MKLSARNILKGTVTRLKRGPLNTLVVIEVAPGIELTAVVTAESASSLKLKKGRTAYAIIKAPSIIVGVDD